MPDRYLYATGSSTVNVYGYDFTYNSEAGAFGGGQLTGFWADDTPLSIDFLNLGEEITYSHVNLVPELATLSLLVIGGLALLRRKRK